MAISPIRSLWEPAEIQIALWNLIGDDVGRRRKAFNFLGQYYFAAEWDIDGLRNFPACKLRFDEILRRSVNAGGFDMAAYVPQLIRFARISRARNNSEQKKAFERGKVPNTESHKTENPDTHWAIYPPIRPGDSREHGKCSMMAVAIMTALGGRMLAAPDEVRRLLASHDDWDTAQLIIQDAGPSAESFFDEIITKLRKGGHAESASLAAIANGSPSRINTLIELFRELEGWAKYTVCSALATLGSSVLDVQPGFCRELQECSKSGGSGGYRGLAVRVLAGLTRGSGVAIDQILDVSYSDNEWDVCESIDAMGEVRACPERVMPRLIELFATFEEPDSDFCYDGMQVRICKAMENYGTDAKPALDLLMANMTQPSDGYDPGHFDKGVLRALAAIGPAARERLPMLELLARENELDAGDFELDHHPLAQAINAIAGLNRTGLMNLYLD